MSRASQFFSLDPEIRLLKRLGDPHKGLKYVHVAGTNGKGSTSAFIASILKNAGYKAGCFTSPYFCSPREMVTNIVRKILSTGFILIRSRLLFLD